MNKTDLEKMFDEADKYDFIEYMENGLDASYSVVNMDKIKQFIFETIIPEVLKSVIPEENEGYLINFEEDNKYALENIIIQDIKQKAKELYGIDL